jgi:H/ACA ribonucleoprotein complex subunit 2
MGSKAATRRLYKCSDTACDQGLKKGEKGLCLIAGDIYPIDVISHLPVLCEEKDTPYIYVPSKHDLGESRVEWHDGREL